ncbi:hypothetical protein DFP72DRAFT_899398 [Ephemerocybe angulata]|uniref:Uncharacterized protein n=1 Tax=Ephemerocybe angulata TaxID=980116 RepID=A0A8H6HX38_9AGAR|nr:hypothetical protein DFP72DRAFT_899398 [Tulosesus angulatus]
MRGRRLCWMTLSWTFIRSDGGGGGGGPSSILEAGTAMRIGDGAGAHYGGGMSSSLRGSVMQSLQIARSRETVCEETQTHQRVGGGRQQDTSPPVVLRLPADGEHFSVAAPVKEAMVRWAAKSRRWSSRLGLMLWRKTRSGFHTAALAVHDSVMAIGRDVQRRGIGDSRARRTGVWTMAALMAGCLGNGTMARASCDPRARCTGMALQSAENRHVGEGFVDLGIRAFESLHR